MGQIKGHVDFEPAKDIPSLKDKIIFITGGTAGLGTESIKQILRHEPAHVYFSGRSAKTGDKVIQSLQKDYPSAALTFVEMDLGDLASVKSAIVKTFTHDRLDLLICNAGIMAAPPGLSKDGFEVQFATNHLGHAMVVRQLLPVLLKTAEQHDVRIVCLTSDGWRGHPRGGIVFDKLKTTQDGAVGPYIRYGQSKLANLMYAAELARRYPSILSVSVHPGIVKTGLVSNLSLWNRAMVEIPSFIQGIQLMTPEQGCYSQLWCAFSDRDKLVNGAFYRPVGVQSNNMLDKTAKSEELARKLWNWTDETLAKF